MPLAPRYRLPATSTPRYPTGVDSVIGCDIAEHFDVQKEEKDFSEAQITQEEILIKINELFEEDVDTV